MYFDYYFYLLKHLETTLCEMGVPSNIVGDYVLKCSSSIPHIEPSPEKNFQQKEGFSKIRIGSSLCVHASKYFERLDYFYTPESLAKEIISKHNNNSEQIFDISIGNEIFLNGSPSNEYLKKWCKDRCGIQGADSETYGFYFTKLKSDNESYLNEYNLNIKENSLKLNILGEATGLKEYYSTSNLSKINQLQILIDFLLNDEFDITAYIQNKPYFSNSIYLIDKVKDILKNNSKGLASSRNPYSKPQYLNILDDYIIETEIILATLSFTEMNSALRKRPELVWCEIKKALVMLVSLWNDPWGRLAIQNVINTSDVKEVSYFKEMIEAIIKFWDSYLTELLELNFEYIYEY